jgi:hypothetical protein
MQAYSYLVPPVGNSIYTLIGNALIDGPHVILDHAKGQLNRLIHYDRMNLVVVFQLLTIAGWSGVNLYTMLKQKRIFLTIIQSLQGFNFYNLVSLFVMGLFFYLVQGFHRIFVANILVTALLLIAHKKYKPIFAIVVLGVIIGQPFYIQYTQWKANFRPDTHELLQTQAIIEEFVRFDEETENRWCNTLLLPVEQYNYRVTLIPPGIGISPIVYPEELSFPLKSKYFLFDQNTYQVYSNRINTKHLASFYESYNIGDLYLNLDSDCPH